MFPLSVKNGVERGWDGCRAIQPRGSSRTRLGLAPEAQRAAQVRILTPLQIKAQHGTVFQKEQPAALAFWDVS